MTDDPIWDAAELVKAIRDDVVAYPGVFDASYQRGNRHDAYVEVRLVDNRTLTIRVT